jgi:hypothetical protein
MTPSAAVKFAKEQLKIAGSGVTIHYWNGKEFTPDVQNTSKAIMSMGSKGNRAAVLSLAQLNEITLALSKEANNVKGITPDTTRLWLEQFFVACRDLHVVPAAIDHARSAVTPQREPAKV